MVGRVSDEVNEAPSQEGIVIGNQEISKRLGINLIHIQIVHLQITEFMLK